MIKSVYGILLLLTACTAVPIKPRYPRGVDDTDCYGTECSYNFYDDNQVEVSFPDNFTHSILQTLPEIQHSQSEMVTLMNKTVDLLEHRLTSMTELMGTMVNMVQDQLYVQRMGRDCREIAVKSAYTYKNNPYVITPQDGKGPMNVFCDMENGGWTVIQKRYDGSVDFYRNWTEYENGFGDSNGEYWLGLKNIRRLISDGSTWVLRVDLESFDGESDYATYDNFSIGDAASNYTLTVGDYSGTAGDCLKSTGSTGRWEHNGMQFSTYDNDNDHVSHNCANTHEGGFWYNACFCTNLNGKYLGRAATANWAGMTWRTMKELSSLKTSQMKIRRVF